MPFVSCSKFNQSQATQDQAIADLAQELLTKQNALNDCTGNPLAGTVPTCAQMATAISDAVAGVSTAPTGAAGGDLEGTYPNPTVKDQAIVDAITGSPAVKTAVAGVFNRCDGTDMPAGASLIECSAKGKDIPYLVNGVIPATQLPAYVDDVLEFPAWANFPATGEAGKIYIDASTGKTFRWSGAGYTEISASAGITVQNEGSVLTTAATSLNFVGAGINANSSGGAVTVTVPSATTTQSGTSELATDAETIAGISTNTVVTPSGLKAAQDAAIALKQNALKDCSGNPLAGTVPTCAQMATAIADAVAGAFTARTFTSAELALANSAQIVVSHNLAKMPRHATGWLKCVAAEHGYAVGDMVLHPLSSDPYRYNEALTMMATSTQLIVRVGDGGPYEGTRKDNGSGCVFTAANWKLIIQASL